MEIILTSLHADILIIHIYSDEISYKVLKMCKISLICNILEVGNYDYHFLVNCAILF